MRPASSPSLLVGAWRTKINSVVIGRFTNALILSRPGHICFVAAQPTRGTMGKTILVTGGARSGKSAIAEAQALSLAPSAIYIATAEARDAEMAARIAAHQARRGPCWVTHPEPLDLTGALNATDGRGPRLVDCLTLWLTNLMLGGHDWQSAARTLVAALPCQVDPVIIVTNEVGGGIVPDNPLAREFRDAAGLLNQWVAKAADDVIFAVAGLPLKVK